jgi:hypothetical protein
MDKKELTKLVSSFVIGDGTLSNLKRYPVNGKYKENKEKNSKYSIKQLSIHKDYIDWQTEILENLTRVRATIIPEHVDNRGYTSHEMISLVTMRHPFYTKMRNNCYLDNRKTINPHFLKLWDAQSLATLYMDDGWLEKKINKNGSVYHRIGIATHSLTYGDNMLIKKMIKEKFAIEFDIARQKQKSGEYMFYLRNSKDNSLRFIDLVSPFIFPSFEYKIEKSVQLTPKG